MCIFFFKRVQFLLLSYHVILCPFPLPCIFCSKQYSSYLLPYHVIFFKESSFYPFPYHVLCSSKVRINFLLFYLPCDFFSKKTEFLTFAIHCNFFFSKRVEFLPFALPCDISSPWGYFFFSKESSSYPLPYLVIFFSQESNFYLFFFFLSWGLFFKSKNQVLTSFLTL